MSDSLAIRDLCVSVAGKPILRGVDLVIRRGEIHALRHEGRGLSAQAAFLASPDVQPSGLVETPSPFLKQRLPGLGMEDPHGLPLGTAATHAFSMPKQHHGGPRPEQRLPRPSCLRARHPPGFPSRMPYSIRASRSSKPAVSSSVSPAMR